MQELNNDNANTRYCEFQKQLMGGKYFLEGKEISKSTIFWMRERLAEDIKRLSSITVEKI